jgi:hypothetical protein
MVDVLAAEALKAAAAEVGHGAALIGGIALYRACRKALIVLAILGRKWAGI